MQKRLDTLFGKLYTPLWDFAVEGYCSPEPLPFDQKEQGTYLPVKGGTRWGKGWDCAWLKLSGEIPMPTEGMVPAFLLDVGGEACLYDAEGTPIKGFTNVQSEFTVALGKPAKQAWLIPEEYYGKTVTLWADAGANDLFGAKPENGIFIRAQAAFCNTSLRDLYYDLEVLAYVAEYSPDEAARKQAADCFDRAYAEQSRAIAAEFLQKPSVNPFTVTALGHAHLDLAWLWPIRETKRKGLRTLSTLVSHMERYPEYRFGVSQPQLLLWVKENAPVLYERLKNLYRLGRLELQGGMWVESDTNLPGGESLVRQLLYGMEFWKEEFDFTPKMVWLPDVFGYTAQLPQLMKKAGLPYFLTTKLSWNGVNQFPYSSFRWKGIDGSEVLAHMPPEGNYNSAARADSITKVEKGYHEKHLHDGAMLLYGIGDGGGGPGMEHLERLAREKNLYGLPKVKQGFAEDYFAELEPARDRLPSWQGELYLEKHQGTYTTQGRTKKGNRVCERLLHEVEFLGATASRLCPDYVYPKEEIKKIWQEVLLYQFHDILPGSCIARVYVEAEARYAELEKQLLSIKADLLSVLLKGDGETLLNVSPYHNHEAYPGKNGYILPKHDVPSYAFAPLRQCRSYSLSYDDTTMENDSVKVTFLPDGTISSVLSKAYGLTEHLRAPGNVLRVFEDLEDGWEVPAPEKLQKEFKVRLTSARTVRKGAALVRTQRYVCGKNVIRQQIVLRDESARLEFVTEVDWKDSHRILRTEFPLTTRNETALCGIQFGAVRRPTTQNTTWEQAKREVCFHKYTDICDDLAGSAILSDSKYGLCIRDCTLSLALLRTPTYPGEGADLGHHSFSYSFCPHKAWEDVVETAYNMEYPLQAVKGKAPFQGSFAEANNLCIETIKPAEDGRGVILRLYNPHNSHVTSFLNTPEELGFTRCIKTDLPENDIEEISPLLTLGPYEILTVRLV